MADMTREQLLRQVHRRLRDAKFAARLTVQADDGTRPIVVALTSDKLVTMLHRVTAVGGKANLVVAVLDGIMVFGIEVDSTSEHNPEERAALDPGCTVGVLVARMIEDGGGTQRYWCPADSEGSSERATTTGGSLLEA